MNTKTHEADSGLATKEGWGGNSDPKRATRAMFHTPTTGGMMLRGASVSYGPEDDNGASDENEDNQAGDDTQAGGETGTGTGDDTVTGGAGDDNIEGDKPSDKEAKLLKDVMKTKTALKAARDAEKAAKDALEAYGGADPAKVRALLEAEAAAERTSLEAKGEYERILAQVNEQHATALAAKDSALAEKDSALEAANRQIDELTIGADFGNSKFLQEETVLSPKKARQLYGAYFERVDGATVAYDKPKGSADRTPLVDAQGVPLGFEAAIAKIVKADEDFERIAKSKLRNGSGSNGSQHKVDEAPKPAAPGVSRIAANLGKLKPTDGKK